MIIFTTISDLVTLQSYCSSSRPLIDQVFTFDIELFESLTFDIGIFESLTFDIGNFINFDIDIFEILTYDNSVWLC